MLEPFASAIDAALDTGATLHNWAAQQPDARTLRGRGTLYVVTLTEWGVPPHTPPGVSAVSVVVRHSWHGGLLAPLTRDLFLAPTRAPHELDVSIRLRHAGVPTPEVIAYATYAVAPGVERADVVTREVHGEDLRSFAEAEPLLVAMTRAGAVHPDLNARNVLVAGKTAYVLDVDRVYFLPPDDPRVIARNRARLVRSVRKLGL